MHRIPALCAIVLGLGTAVPALADSDSKCGNVPAAQWMSTEAASAKAAELGYQVHEIKADDGCYKIEGVAKNGAKVELRMNPATGVVVASDDEEDDD